MILDWLQRLIVAVFLVLFFRGRGSHAVFVGAIAALPAARLLFSPATRARARRAIASAHAAAVAGDRMPWRALAMFAALPMLFFALANGRNIPSLDNYGASLTAASIVLHGTTDVTRMFPPERAAAICRGQEPAYYLRCASGGIYSAYPIGMALWALPTTLVARLVGAPLTDGYALWRLAKWTGALLAALGVACFLAIALRLSEPAAAYLATAFLVTGSPLLAIVGQGLWSQGGVAVAWLLVLLLEVRFPRQAPGRWDVAQGVLIALMLSCRLTAATFILPFGAWLLWYAPRRAVTVTATAFAAVAPLAWHHYRIFGNMLGPQAVMGAGMGRSPEPWNGFFGSLFSHECGLLVYQPWLWLFLAPRAHAWRGPRGLAVCLAACFCTHLLMLTQWPYWWGGAWGSRNLTESVPTLALVLLPSLAWLWRRRLGRLSLAATGLLAFVIHAVGVYGPAIGWFYHIYRDRKYEPDWAFEHRRMMDWSEPAFLWPWIEKHR